MKHISTAILFFLAISIMLSSCESALRLTDDTTASGGSTSASEESLTEEITTAAEQEPIDPARRVSAKVMQDVYERLQTPYKYGAVMKFDDALCDSPAVFYHEGAWYMSYIKIDKQTSQSGYESYLAKSDDLLHWETLHPIMQRTEDGAWDSKQCAAYAAYVENDLYGNYTLQKVNGSYYFSYLGGNLNGYETDPLKTGLCRAEDVLDPNTYHRFADPILAPEDADAREGERLTLYKSNLFIDERETLGHRYVNAYNAKDSDHVERIFLAVSDDGESWTRHGKGHVLWEPNAQITGDPQILQYGDLYIMVYFVLRDGRTYNNFAASYDLEHWTRWTGDPLIFCEYDWENVFAHKTSIVYCNGVLYHFYCAVNSDGERFIAVAASQKVW